MSRSTSGTPRSAAAVAAGRAFLRAALVARRSAGEHTALVLPAPALQPGGRGPAGDLPSVFFASAEGPVITGWGRTAVATRADHDLAAIRAEVERIHRATTIVAHPELRPGAERSLAWVGGHAFSPHQRPDPAWTSFPAACFVAPRWTHRIDDDVATLVLFLGPDEPVDVPRLLDEYTALAAGSAPPARRPASGAPLLRIGADGRERWIALARSVLADIERGAVQKVVLARDLDLAFDRTETLDVVRILHDLGRDFPSCTRFLFAPDGAEFFGATPETLVQRTGDRIRAEAMAGSCRPGDEARLEASAKEAREHTLVVEHLVARLAPRAAALDVAPAPALRRFANITHLWTPVQGRLDRPVHVLDLVAELHPTPAVAGTPTPAALALLERAERVARGWFAGPFGWFDATGDGHFVVALRSCVRHAGGVRLYAGAGLVKGSDPEREFDETTLKMHALLDTLHAITDEPADRVG